MTLKELIQLIEENTSARYNYSQHIPMGMSLHFSVTESTSEEMLTAFGKDFDKYENGEGCFFITNGKTLKKKNT